MPVATGRTPHGHRTIRTHNPKLTSEPKCPCAGRPMARTDTTLLAPRHKLELRGGFSPRSFGAFRRDQRRGVGEPDRVRITHVAAASRRRARSVVAKVVEERAAPALA